MQYSFINNRTSQAETSKAWFVSASVYQDNEGMEI